MMMAMVTRTAATPIATYGLLVSKADGVGGQNARLFVLPLSKTVSLSRLLPRPVWQSGSSSRSRFSIGMWRNSLGLKIARMNNLMIYLQWLLPQKTCVVHTTLYWMTILQQVYRKGHNWIMIISFVGNGATVIRRNVIRENRLDIRMCPIFAD